MRFRPERRWATLAVAVVLGAAGGGALGFATAPVPSGDGPQLAPSSGVAAPTTRRPRGRVAGISSTTRPGPRVVPAASGSAVRPTTTTARPTSTTLEATTTTAVATTATVATTTTIGQDTTSSTSSTLPASSTTSTT